MLQNTPQVVKNLIILNVIMYVVSGLMGDAAVPLLAGRTRVLPFPALQVVTHMFMHGDLGHIFFNMFALVHVWVPVGTRLGPPAFLDVLCRLWARGVRLARACGGTAVLCGLRHLFPAVEQFVSPNASPLQKARVMEIVRKGGGASGAVWAVPAFGMLFPTRN